jgi:hypothetical protein
MIRKTGNIVGEQVMANAGLIKSLQKSVDELRKEVNGLRCEVKERKARNENERRIRKPN